ncbi:MAG: DUF29 domain-containing protein [Cyanobacteriota bacterium]|nr:DUF29 domain-containing protein [Cyanobacteriota bacterium]
MTQSLYDHDILLWVEDTVSKLKTRDFDSLDLENLIEEVESLGRSEKRELLSRLTILIEHLIKRLYVSMPENYRGWETTIRNQRTELGFLLKDAPSLKAFWGESFALALATALKNLCKEYPQVNFPQDWIYTNDLDLILTIDFWEVK